MADGSTSTSTSTSSKSDGTSSLRDEEIVWAIRLTQNQGSEKTFLLNAKNNILQSCESQKKFASVLCCVCGRPKTCKNTSEVPCLAFDRVLLLVDEFARANEINEVIVGPHHGTELNAEDVVDLLCHDEAREEFWNKLLHPEEIYFEFHW